MLACPVIANGRPARGISGMSGNCATAVAIGTLPRIAARTERAARIMSISSGRQQLLEHLRRGGAHIREVQRPADLERLTDEGPVDLPAHRAATHRGRELAVELGALD